MKVSELEGALLDRWVAEAEGMLRMMPGTIEQRLGGYSPSTNWREGGPIIEREHIDLSPGGVDVWDARFWGDFSNTEKARWVTGPTPLMAAMRAYVASKFGDEVPEEP